jgi:hypothetical protein
MRPPSFVRAYGAPAAALAVLLCASAAQAGDVVITEAARSRFSAGVNLLKDPDGPRYEEAYREFKAAYAESPSYKILANLGLCAMKLERDDEAIEAIEKYLKEAPSPSPEEAAQMKADVHTLKAGLVHVTLKSSPAGALITDVRVPVQGERVTNAYGPLKEPTKLGIRQGHHVITAKLAGYPDVVWETDASGGAELGEHEFEFKMPETAPVAAQPVPGADLPAERSRPVPTAVWIGVAATGALAVGTVVTGAMASSKKSEFNARNDGSDPAAAKSLRDSGQTLNLVTDVMLGATVVAAGVTAYFFFTRPTVESPRAGSVRPVPMVSSSGGGMWLSGTF